MYTILAVLIAAAAVSAKLTEPGGCGSEFGCYSKDCDSTCKFVVTWKDGGGDTVDFTLSLTLEQGAGDQWIALGLSGDTKMGSDSVTQCVQNSGSIEIQKTWNIDNGKANSPLSEGEDATTGLTAMSSDVTDGVLTCRYTQNKISSNAEIANLNTDWYLLVANGRAAGGTKLQHSIVELPSISPKKVDLQSTENVSGTLKPVLVKLHGCLMMFAWIFCASIGIVMARFYKLMWPNDKLLKEKVWFTVHRCCMVTALLFCAAGFIVIFVEVQEWSKLEGSTQWQRAHPYLGVIVTFLCILNPIMALFRPHPDGEFRFLFNWAHWLVGMCAHILSVMTLILGVTLSKAEVPFYCVWILVGWAGYQMFVVLLLELHECCVADNRKKYLKNGQLKAPKGSLVRTIVLVVHVLIILGFTAACIVIVAIN